MRSAEITRETKETQIQLNLNVDGNGTFTGTSGIGFFDHMLTAFAVHGGFALTLHMQGDLHVDGHHSVEAVGIVLGKAFAQAVNKGEIERFGNAYVPMDEALAFCALDISGRPYLAFDAVFSNQSVGELDCCLVEEFFRAFAMNSGITLHIRLERGSNDHHKIEAIFKAVARALKQAVILRRGTVLSSKGVLA